MEKKYKLTEETINVNGKTLHRIEALRDFGDVKKGNKGGFIEKENNLSQSGDCWVYGNARVYSYAQVYDNAVVYGNAKVYGTAMVYGNAKVYEDARIYGNAKVFDDAKVYGTARVFGNAWVFCNASIYGDASICNNAEVYGYAYVYGNASIYGDASICNNAEVYGYAYVYGNAEIRGDAEIASNSDYIVFKNWWSSGRYFTWTKSNNMWKVGCFYGTGEELIEKAYKDSEKSGREYEKIVKYVESILEDNNADV